MQKALILVSGPPGAGKSTFSKPLVEEFGLTWLEIDCVGNPFSAERGSEYKQRIEPALIKGLLNLAELNLSAGHSVLLDLPWTLLMFENPDLPNQISQLADKMQAKLIIFECIICEASLRQRILQRGAQRDFDKIKDDAAWQNFLNQLHFPQRNPMSHFVINTEDEATSNFYLAKNHIYEMLQTSFTPTKYSYSV